VGFLVVRVVASEVVPETNFAVDRKAKMQKQQCKNASRMLYVFFA
jgi:hypothetical protein